MKTIWKQVLGAMLSLGWLSSARADLPTPVEPSTAPADGDWIGLIEGPW
jgi:hypothetical protein